jgi:hypothetical protein
VSARGINRPRHQTSHWLKAAESSTVGWSNTVLFQASVQPVLLAVALHCSWPLTQLFWCYAPTHRRIIRCWGPRGQNHSGNFYAIVGRNNSTPVGSSGAWGFILARLCLVQTWSLDRPTVPSNGPLIHPMLLSSFLPLCNSCDATRKWTVGSSDGALVFSQCTNSYNHCTDACYLGTVGSSKGVLSFSFLSRFLPLKNRLSSQFGMWYFCIHRT